VLNDQNQPASQPPDFVLAIVKYNAQVGVTASRGDGNVTMYILCSARVILPRPRETCVFWAHFACLQRKLSVSGTKLCTSCCPGYARRTLHGWDTRVPTEM